MKKLILFHLSMLIGFCSMPCIAQTTCTDFSYTIKYDEYRTVNDNTSIQDIGDLNLYKFKNKTKKKHVRKFVNENGDPVKVTAIIDAVNYYPQTVQLPLISVYGETNFLTVVQSFDQVNGLSEGTLGKGNSWSQNFSSTISSNTQIPNTGTLTNFGTLINHYPKYSTGTVGAEDYISNFETNVLFNIPSSDDLMALTNAGYQVLNDNHIISIIGTDHSIIIDVNNLTIRYNYPDGSYQFNTYSSTNYGPIYLETSTDVSFETLVNGLCTEKIIVSTYGDYMCMDQAINFYENTATNPSSVLNLYPNPTNDYLHVNLSEDLQGEMLDFTVRDLSGKALGGFRYEAAEQIALPMQEIITQDGMYVLSIRSKKISLTQKFFFTTK